MKKGWRVGKKNEEERVLTRSGEVIVSSRESGTVATRIAARAEAIHVMTMLRQLFRNMTLVRDRIENDTNLGSTPILGRTQDYLSEVSISGNQRSDNRISLAVLEQL
jgi:hypothetical protein